MTRPLLGVLATLSAFHTIGCSGSPASPSGGASANMPPTVSSVSVSRSMGLQDSTSFAFSVQANDPNGDALTYTWDFGDQSSGSGAAASHVYSRTGAFTPRVTVSDGQGTATGQTTLTVRDLSGRWTRALTSGSCEMRWVLTLTQSGRTLSGSMGLEAISACPGMSFGTKPAIAGEVSSAGPVVTWTGVGIIGGSGTNTFTAGINADVTSLTDIAHCTPRPPLPDVCVSGTYNPLVRD